MDADDLSINRANWDERAPVHAASSMYGLDRYLNDPAFIGAKFAPTESRSWNHGLGEIITALLDEGMTLTAFEEHDSVPSEMLPGRMERTDVGEWRLADRPERLPHSYTLQAVKA